MRALILSLVLLAAPVQAATQLDAEAAATIQSGLTATADGFILPAYAAQAEAAAQTVTALSAYCAGGAPLEAAQAGFADTFLAWQRSSIVSLGPIAEAEGPMRVQLWPDPKGFSERAVRAALQAEDPALLAPGGLVGRSIALSNLMALEALLYGDLPPGSYACDLATAIAAFQADLAGDLVAAWTPGSPFRADYDTAAQGNARFPDAEALVRDLLAGAVVYVDRLRKFKILRGLGTAPGEARAERTEAVKSGLGLPGIIVAFDTLRDLYAVNYGLFDIAPDIGGAMDYYLLAQTAASIAAELSVEDATLAEIARADGAAAARLRGHADAVLFHEQFLKTGFTDAIGMTAGFTAADGD